MYKRPFMFRLYFGTVLTKFAISNLRSLFYCIEICRRMFWGLGCTYDTGGAILQEGSPRPREQARRSRPHGAHPVYHQRQRRAGGDNVR